MVSLKKIVNTSFIIELLTFCGLAAFFYGIYNYSLEEPIWTFNLWLVIETICFVVVGGFMVFSIQVKDVKRAFFFLNIQTILVSLGLILWGLDVIHRKRVLIRLEHFIGADADLIGKFSIGAGIVIIVWSLSSKNIKLPPAAASRTAMCANCLTPYSKQTLTETACPKCGGALEDLEGFYEKHPDKQADILKSNNGIQNSSRKPLIWNRDSKEGLRMLLIIIFLMLIVSYALWQSFVVHGFK